MSKVYNIQIVVPYGDANPTLDEIVDRVHDDASDLFGVMARHLTVIVTETEGACA